MAKPYLLYKKSSGNYFAEVLLPDGTRSNRKSTGTSNKQEAEQIVMTWIVTGNFPKHINGREKTTNNYNNVTFFNHLKDYNFSNEDIVHILKILKSRKFIISAVLPGTKKSIPLLAFLEAFWNYETSPYIREKLLKGQTIHKEYCDAHISRIKKYWTPLLKDKTVGELTRDDVNCIFSDSAVAKLAPKTINNIVSSLTIPMKYAYLNKFTVNNCYDGIIKVAKKTKKRDVLTMEQALELFTTGTWENDTAKLANMLAFYTGMRQGEIAALRVMDIGLDRIYIRHSWSKYEGLKETKTDECREILIPPLLREDLLNQARFNPHNEGLKNFIFFGLKPSQPTDPGNWRKYLHRALASIGYPDPKSICFHAWRHLWCSRVSDIETDKRVVMAGSGHKTEFMLDHYAEHLEKEKALNKLAEVTNKLFLPILKQADGIVDAKIIKDDSSNTEKGA